ncbi:MAG: hypothetical protein ACR2K5_13235 [Pseudolabrys sp.]
MKTTTEKAAEALDLLPEEMREPAVAYLIEQAEKFRTLKQDLEKGMADVTAGRLRAWNFGDFLRRANISPSGE